jgi:hypothetical protein
MASNALAASTVPFRGRTSAKPIPKDLLDDHELCVGSFIVVRGVLYNIVAWITMLNLTIPPLERAISVKAGNEVDVLALIWFAKVLRQVNEQRTYAC